MAKYTVYVTRTTTYEVEADGPEDGEDNLLELCDDDTEVDQVTDSVEVVPQNASAGVTP
jgi:hypothetical protein